VKRFSLLVTVREERLSSQGTRTTCGSRLFLLPARGSTSHEALVRVMSAAPDDDPSYLPGVLRHSTTGLASSESASDSRVNFMLLFSALPIGSGSPAHRFACG